MKVAVNWIRTHLSPYMWPASFALMPLVLLAMLMLNQTPSPAIDEGPGPGNLKEAVNFSATPGKFETALVAMQAQVDLGNGVIATALTFNGTVPGPLFRLKVGEKVTVHFTNNLPIPASIHWHGIELTNRSDGTGITQDAVPVGGTYIYDFIVPRPGVYFYHSHIAPTNPSFKGFYGVLIVEDPTEKELMKLGAIPKQSDTKVLVLGDTTVCKEPGSNDSATFPADASLPWAGGPAFPGKPAVPTPKDLCETKPLDEHGHFVNPVVALPAGAIPNIQPTPDCGSGGEPGCPTNEGQLVLTNGQVAAARAGSPAAPGALAAGAEVIKVKAGDGIRLQLASAATTRYFRLRLTCPTADPCVAGRTDNQIPLYRIGGQGGILDNVRLEGGIQGTLDTLYDEGEILLPVASREDVVFMVPVGTETNAIITLWTLDYQRNGGGQGSNSFQAVPTVPVAHFQIEAVGSQNPKFTIAANDPLRTNPAVNQPIESIKSGPVDALLDSSLFVPPQPGSADETIRLTAVGKPGINGFQNFIFDEGATPPAPFTSVPHVSESRWATVGTLLELTIFNDTSAHHPWHPHGFSIQAVRFTDPGGATLFTLPYNEFVDTVDIPPHTKLVYRVRLEDRPFDFSTPVGGAIGRWAMHCHIFFHAAIGMITELVVQN